jgi:hypothetical protein
MVVGSDLVVVGRRRSYVLHSSCIFLQVFVFTEDMRM